MSISIPIMALSDTSTTLDMSIPFSYNLPNMTSFYHGRRGRLEAEHKSIFHTAEEMLAKYILTIFPLLLIRIFQVWFAWQALCLETYL